MSENCWSIVVVEGRCREAVRPVRGRATVGSSPHCDIVLSDCAPVHSLIVAGEDGVRVAALHPEPEIRVRGEATESSELICGEHFRVGPYRFEVRSGAIAQTVAEHSTTVAAVPAAVHSRPHRFALSQVLSAAVRRGEANTAVIPLERKAA